MNPIKWLRKNNKKIMAVVVVLLMIAFVGGTWLSSISRGRGASPKDTRAFYGDNKKITANDLFSAQRGLNVLKKLRADEFLKNMSLPISGGELDIQAALLGELLFGEKQYSGAVSSVLRQAIQRRGYLISDRQINEIYTASMPREAYWFLLCKEAEQGGILVSNEAAKNVLEQILAQMSRGNTQKDQPGYGALMQSVMNEFRISEDDALSVFGELLSVVRYTSMMCSNENVTVPQLLFEASVMEEPMEVSLVRFDSAVFADSQPEPSKDKVAAQFEKYKGTFSGEVTEENPYGFGYKHDDAVVLDYIAVRLDEIKKLVPEPTEEEKERFYQKFKDQFVERIAADANVPNSFPTQRARSYAEVAHLVSQQLLQNTVNTKAGKIMQDAMSLADASMPDLSGSKKVSIEQLKAGAVDYNKIAADLTAKHNVKVYAGRTGQLTAADVRKDKSLASLFVRGQGTDMRGIPLMVWLYQVVFAVEQIGASELGPSDVPAPKMYENIGPLRDAAGQITAIIRIVDAKKAFEPESADQTISRETLDLGLPADTKESDIYSVAENVTKDIKRLAAMKTTAAKAEEFVELAKKDGFDKAVAEFNKLYGKAYTEATDEPNAFKVQDSDNLKRMSKKTLDGIAFMSRGKPGAQAMLRSRDIERLFMDKLYALVPQEKTTLENLPAIVEFEPTLSYYVIKGIKIDRLGETGYETTKCIRAYSEDLVQAQSIAAVYLNPENIVKRSKFKYVELKAGQLKPVYESEPLPVDEGF